MKWNRGGFTITCRKFIKKKYTISLSGDVL